MRILWLAPEPPVAPLTGGRERARQMLTYLSARHRVHLLTLAEESERAALQALARQLDDLTVVAYQACRQENRGALVTRLEQLLARSRPQRLHIQGLDVWPGARLGADCVLDLHDVPSLLEERMQATRRWSKLAALLSSGLSRIRSLERQALQAARHVIVASPEDEHALARHRMPLPSIVSLPNGVDLRRWQLAGSEADVPTLLFPGALNWPPNIDAAKVLVTAVLPLVQQRQPQVQLILSGRRPHPDLATLAAADPAVTLLPDPADMGPLFVRAQAIVVPLRAATGTRLKILQALAAGRPVISTPAGAAGLDLVPGRHLLVASLVEPFAAGVVALLEDQRLRRRLMANGRSAVAAYDWSRLLPALDAVYPAQGATS